MLLGAPVFENSELLVLGAPKVENCEILALGLVLGSSLLLQGWVAVVLLGAPGYESFEILALAVVSVGIGLSGGSSVGLSPWRTWWVGTGQ